MKRTRLRYTKAGARGWSIVDGNLSTDRSVSMPDTTLVGGKPIMASCQINDIGSPGGVGFGVGVCPPGILPAGFTPLPGYNVLGHANYGNYQYSDGSIMVWVPKYYYRINHPDNPTYANNTTINAVSAATKANPGVVTITGHGIPVGTTNAKIRFDGIGGMVELNGNTYTCTAIDANTVSIGVDTNGFTAYTSGGWATGPGNSVDVKGAGDFASTAAANAAGYALHRAFIDGGVEQPGFMVDKYMCSKNAKGTGFVASSIKGGNPISTASTHNPIAELSSVSTGNIYASAIQAAKGRSGANGAYDATSIFHCASRFQYAALALLSLAHGQAVASTANCAWWEPGKAYPKGCNNNALRDTDDTTVIYASDGYSNCGKTGSGSPFAKTTHNGQDCGVADLNGLMWEVSIGATCIAASRVIEAATKANPCVITITGHGYQTGQTIMITGNAVGGMVELNDKLFTITVIDANSFSLDGVNSSAYVAFTTGGTVWTGAFYAAKQATRMRNFTNGDTLATDHWGATGVAAMMEPFTPAFKTAGGGPYAQRFGSGANQVLSEATSGADWTKAGLGFPKDASGMDTVGVDLFGKDYYYQYIRNELCLLSCASWSYSTNAGVWTVGWNGARADSYGSVGFRAACYLV